jgi:hypothetical protein
MILIKNGKFLGLQNRKKDEFVRMKYLQRLELIGLNMKDVFSHCLKLFCALKHKNPNF